MGITQAELFDYKEAENTLQDWIDRGGAKKLFGLNASAHMALAWLTAKRGDWGRSRHWLSHLKTARSLNSCSFKKTKRSISFST